MGRHPKTVMTMDGVDRRENGYYSTPRFVTQFITEELLVQKPNGQIVFDPCVGKEEMTWAFKQSGKTVTGWDVEDFGVHEIAQYEQKDFLEFYGNLTESRIMNQPVSLPYDYYIANPPYNCHESTYIRENKKRLKKVFARIGVANMYSMFMSAMIDLAKPGAVLGMIAHDSFLTSRLHEGLREQILKTCQMTHLLLCPVDLFHGQHADVRTCILILIKGTPERAYPVTILNRTESTQKFAQALASRDFKKEKISKLVLRSNQDRQEFVVGCLKGVRKLFRFPRLGQLFRCVTGISTGNDSKYLNKTSDSYYTIPFYKNPGTRRFCMDPDAYLPKDFLTIAKNIRSFQIRNKDLLFKPGIACSSMGIPFGACALPSGATYGVNANIFCDEEDRWWLLSYLNSSLVTYLVRGVLLRTNMITSGYVSRIPILPISEAGKERLSLIAKQAVERKIQKADYIKVIADIDEVVFSESTLSAKEVRLVQEFRENIAKRT